MTAQRLSSSACGAEVRGGGHGENGPISRRKSPSNGGPECRYDASLAAKVTGYYDATVVTLSLKHDIQASLIGKLYLTVLPNFKHNEVASSKGTRGQPSSHHRHVACE